MRQRRREACGLCSDISSYEDPELNRCWRPLGLVGVSLPASARRWWDPVYCISFRLLCPAESL